MGGSRRGRAHAPREMDQPPALKTRRSNAVQTRRLALHLSLLERHLAALEAERERDVRVLQEELSHLQHAPGGAARRMMLASPHVERDAHRDADKERRRKPWPVLQRSVSAENHKGRRLAHTQPLVTREALPPITVQQDPVSKDESNELTISRSTEGINNQSDSSEPHLESCFTGNQAGSESTTTSGGKGRVYLSKSESRKFLPPVDHDHNPCQGQGHTQMKTHMDSEEGTASEGNAPDVQQGKIRGTPQSFEEFRESKSAVIDVTKTEEQLYKRSAKDPVHRSELDILTEPKASSLKLKALSEPPPRQRTPTTRSTRSRDNRLHTPKKRCHLAGARNKCGHFPCTQPPTYHSLGFHPDHTTHPWRHWLHQNACRPHHRLVPGRPSPAQLKGLPEGEEKQEYMRRRRLGKEELVRMDMARKKQMHALARPPSWNTNYGQPTPFKRLKNPVRLTPLL